MIAPAVQSFGGNYSVANPAQQTLVLYYDYFDNRNPDLNAKLVVPGVEVAFGGNAGNEPMPIPGAKTSMRMSPDEFTYENVYNYLMIYDYVHIDEMNNDKTTCAEDCATVAQKIAEVGLGGRIIFFFRFSYTGAGLSTQTSLLQAGLNGWLRKIYFETYGGDFIYTSNVGSAYSKLQQWSASFGATLQGSNLVVSPAIGIRNGNYNDPYLNVCDQDLNALYTIFSDMHQIQVDWKGCAFYGASETMNVCTYTVPDLVDKCAGLTSWWSGK